MGVRRKHSARHTAPEFIISLCGARVFRTRKLHRRILWARARSGLLCSKPHRALISHAAQTLWQAVGIKILICTHTTIKGGAENWNKHIHAEAKKTMVASPSKYVLCGARTIFSRTNVHMAYSTHYGSIAHTKALFYERGALNLSDCRVYTVGQTYLKKRAASRFNKILQLCTPSLSRGIIENNACKYVLGDELREERNLLSSPRACCCARIYCFLQIERSFVRITTIKPAYPPFTVMCRRLDEPCSDLTL
jgi:hypothetical protein